MPARMSAPVPVTAKEATRASASSVAASAAAAAAMAKTVPGTTCDRALVVVANTAAASGTGLPSVTAMPSSRVNRSSAAKLVPTAAAVSATEKCRTLACASGSAPCAAGTSWTSRSRVVSRLAMAVWVANQL